MGSRRRRGRDVDIPRRRVPATPRSRRGYSVTTRRGRSLRRDVQIRAPAPQKMIEDGLVEVGRSDGTAATAGPRRRRDASPRRDDEPRPFPRETRRKRGIRRNEEQHGEGEERRGGPSFERTGFVALRPLHERRHRQINRISDDCAVPDFPLHAPLRLGLGDAARRRSRELAVLVDEFVAFQAGHPDRREDHVPNDDEPDVGVERLRPAEPAGGFLLQLRVMRHDLVAVPADSVECPRGHPPAGPPPGDAETPSLSAADELG